MTTPAGPKFSIFDKPTDKGMLIIAMITLAINWTYILPVAFMKVTYKLLNVPIKTNNAIDPESVYAICKSFCSHNFSNAGDSINKITMTIATISQTLVSRCIVFETHSKSFEKYALLNAVQYGT